jgi:hypothetical protein
MKFKAAARFPKTGLHVEDSHGGREAKEERHEYAIGAAVIGMALGDTPVASIVIQVVV